MGRNSEELVMHHKKDWVQIILPKDLHDFAERMHDFAERSVFRG